MGKGDYKDKASGIFCTPHYLKVGKSASSWVAGKQQGNGKHEQTAEHAERKAYALVANEQDAKIFCLVTNDFPCQYCTTFFLVESKKKQRHFILRATENGGAYAPVCGARSTTDKDKFDKTLSGDLYISDGKLYVAGRKITVSDLPDKFTDKHGSNESGVKTATIVSAVAQGADKIALPASFDDLPKLPT